MPTDLLNEIRDFLTESRMGPTYFGKLACGIPEVVPRLEAGRTVTLETAKKIRAFIKERRAPVEAAE